MNSTLTQVSDGATLASRLQAAPLPVAQALRHAQNLAAALRAVHAKGQICGVLDPAQIHLTDQEAVIAPATTDFTPYAAPELFTGSRPDMRSDIFAFGGIVYHLLTGRQPFPGDSAATVSQALREVAPSPLGPLTDGHQEVTAEQFPGLERAIMRCLEKHPDQRWQRVQAVYMELRLLSIAASRVDPAVNSRRARAEAQLREEVSRLERALEARIAVCDQSLTELQRSASETRDRVKVIFDSIEKTFSSHAQSIETLHANAARTDDFLERVVESIAACDQSVVHTRDQVKAAMESMEGKIGMQAHSIETLSATVSRTDDLLERVVESIDSLQSFVLECAVGTAAPEVQPVSLVEQS